MTRRTGLQERSGALEIPDFIIAVEKIPSKVSNVKLTVFHYFNHQSILCFVYVKSLNKRTTKKEASTSRRSVTSQRGGWGRREKQHMTSSLSQIITAGSESVASPERQSLQV